MPTVSPPVVQVILVHIGRFGFRDKPIRFMCCKIIDGKQCTIGWYVDDNIITRVDPNQVTWVIDKIEERFGKMVVSRGKSHEFLGHET